MSILMRGIENSEVEAKTFIVICRTEGMTVFTDGFGESVISANFDCASYGATGMKILARAMFGAASVD